MSDLPTLSQYMGREFRRRRQEAGLTLEQMAAGMRDLGFRWQVSRVVELEAGKVSPTLGVMLGLLSVLARNAAPDSDLTDFKLSDLFKWTERIEISPGVVAGTDDIHSAIKRGQPLETALSLSREAEARAEIDDESLSWLRGLEWSRERLEAARESYGLADVRAAKSLGVTLAEFITIAASLWADSLTETTTRRTPEGANAQVRGRATRRLVAEARDYLDEMRHQRDA